MRPLVIIAMVVLAMAAASPAWADSPPRVRGMRFECDSAANLARGSALPPDETPDAGSVPENGFADCDFADGTRIRLAVRTDPSWPKGCGLTPTVWFSLWVNRILVWRRQSIAECLDPDRTAADTLPQQARSDDPDEARSDDPDDFAVLGGVWLSLESLTISPSGVEQCRRAAFRDPAVCLRRPIPRSDTVEADIEGWLRAGGPARLRNLEEWSGGRSSDVCRAMQADLYKPGPRRVSQLLAPRDAVQPNWYPAPEAPVFERARRAWIDLDGDGLPDEVILAHSWLAGNIYSVIELPPTPARGPRSFNLDGRVANPVFAWRGAAYVLGEANSDGWPIQVTVDQLTPDGLLRVCTFVRDDLQLAPAGPTR
jgi:hypothetical protein